MSGFEYRVVWKRAGQRVKRKKYARRAEAERFMIVLGPEPWKARGKGPDDLECCDGRECGCGGLTTRQFVAEKYADQPPIEWMRMESRPVGVWSKSLPPVVGYQPIASGIGAPNHPPSKP